MDWKEALLTDDFKAFRKRQAKEIALIIGAEINADPDPKYFKGLLDMAKRIIRLPSQLIKDEKLNLELDRLLMEDLTNLTIEIVREQLKEE